MNKPLAEMTLEELWELFPIILEPHREKWALWYSEEKARLISCLPGQLSLHHIGSTAIQGIWAKPIVDILVEIPVGEPMESLTSPLIQAGYTCMSEESGRMSFNKGYTPQGFADKVFHLHLRHVGDHAELYFRDYMNDHPHLAKQYESLKLALWKKFEHNRDAYTMAKAAFISTHTAAAQELYKLRYETPKRGDSSQNASLTLA